MTDSAVLISWVSRQDLELDVLKYIEAGWIPDDEPTLIVGGGWKQTMHRPSVTGNQT